MIQNVHLYMNLKAIISMNRSFCIHFKYKYLSNAMITEKAILKASIPICMLATTVMNNFSAYIYILHCRATSNMYD